MEMAKTFEELMKTVVDVADWPGPKIFNTDNSDSGCI